MRLDPPRRSGDNSLSWLNAEWWTRRLGRFPRWVWLCGVVALVAAIGSIAEGNTAEQDGTAVSRDAAASPDTSIEPNAASSTTSAPVTTLPATSLPTTTATVYLPPISQDALAYLGITACYPPDAEGWWACTNGVGTAMITTSSDEALTLQYIGARPDYGPSTSHIWSLPGGGVVYMPSGEGFPTSPPAPSSGMSLVDLDCPNSLAPALCPPATTAPEPEVASPSPMPSAFDEPDGNDGKIDDLEWLALLVVLEGQVPIIPSRSALTDLGEGTCELAGLASNGGELAVMIALAAEGSGLDVEVAAKLAGATSVMMCEDEMERLGFLIPS